MPMHGKHMMSDKEMEKKHKTMGTQKMGKMNGKKKKK